MFERLRRISKRKLILYIAAIFFVVLAFGSIIAAKTGYFPKLAEVLNIKADTTSGPPPPRSVRFDVHDQTGRPLSGVSVWLELNYANAAPLMPYELTDINGRAIFGTLPANALDVFITAEVTKSGCSNHDTPPFKVSSTGAYGYAGSLNITCDSGGGGGTGVGSLIGTVRNDTSGAGGAILDGATISVRNSNGVVLGTAVSTTSTGQYNYMVANIPAGGPYTVTVAKIGFTSSPVSQTTNIPANGTSQLFWSMSSTGGGSVTQDKGTLRGKITNGSGAMVKGVVITVQDLVGNVYGTTTSTDSYSLAVPYNYSIPNILAGGQTVPPYQVIARLSGYSSNPYSQDIRIAKDTTSEANFVMTSTGGGGGTDTGTKFDLIGSIQDEAGNAIKDVKVKVSAEASADCFAINQTEVTSAPTTYYLNSSTSLNIDYAFMGLTKPFIMTSSVCPIKLQFTSDKYFYDANGNGLDDDNNAPMILNISNSDIKTTGNNRYVNNGLTLKRKTFDVVGKISLGIGQNATNIIDTGNPIEGVRLEIKGIISSNCTVSTGVLRTSRTGEVDVNYECKDIPKNTDQYLVKFYGTKPSFIQVSKPDLSNGDIIDLPYDISSSNSKTDSVKYDVYREDMIVSINSGNFLSISVEDSNGDSIEGAQVSSKNISCSSFHSSSVLTDSSGHAYLYWQKMGQELEQEHPECSTDATQIAVSKEGYLSTERYIPTDLRNGLDIVLTKPGYPLDNKSTVYGIVQDKSDPSIPIANATVNLYRDNPSAINFFRTVKTDSSGHFNSGKIDPGNYVIFASHPDYMDDFKDWVRLSRISVVLKSGEGSFVTLTLKKYEFSDKVNVPIQVLDQVTLNPLSDADITISRYDGSEPDITGKSDENGFYTDGTETEKHYVPLTIGARYEIKAVCSTVSSDVQEIEILRNWNDLTNEQRDEIYRKGIIFIKFNDPDDVQDQGKLTNDLRFEVTDSITKKPIEGARISFIYSMNTSRSVPLRGIPNTEVANTKADGTAKWKDDFKYFYDYQEPFGADSAQEWPSDLSQYQKIMFETGDKPDFEFYKEGYRIGQYSNAIDAANHPTIKVSLDPISIAKGAVNVYYDNASIDTSSAFGNETLKSIYDSIYLEKYNDTSRSWTKVEIQSNKLVETGQGELKQFLPTQPGKYRAVAKSGLKTQYSDEIVFKTGDIKDLRFNSCDTSLYVNTKKYPNNITFAFSDDISSHLYSLYSEKFDEWARQLSYLKSKNDSGPSLVVWGKQGYVNAHYSDACLASSNTSVIVYNTELLTQDRNSQYLDGVFPVLAHEYGHSVFQKLKLKSNPVFYNGWVSLFNSIANSGFSDCVWSGMYDFNTSGSLINGGHPWDDYGGSDPGHEMFASFFNGFFVNHDRLLGQITSNTPKDSQCQNTLKYLWEYFSENIGQVSDSDHGLFQPVGRKIGNATYTFGQIMRGEWMQSRYNALGNGVSAIITKSAIQYQIIIGPLARTLSIDQIRGRLLILDNWLNGVLQRAGLLSESGTVKGTLIMNPYDSNRVMSKYIIKIGPKTAVTDRNGNFLMTKVPKGVNKIISVEFYPDKKSYYFNSSPKRTVFVNKGEITEVQIEIFK